jgi:hypothetical protein
MGFLRKALPSLLFFSLLVYAALLLFSVNYGVIQPGLDPSWGFAANQFAHGPFRFGLDLVFTYGPLAYLAVPEHVGNNIVYAAIAHILIWCVLLYMVVGLWQGGRRAGATIFLLGLILSNRLYYFYWDYLLVALVLLLFLLLLDRPQSREALVLLVMLAGLCFLVKFTAYIVTMVLVTVFAVWRLVPLSKTSLSEKVLIAAAFAAGPVAYLFYTPSLAGLMGFIYGSLQESTGHSAAMSTPATYELGLRGLVLCAGLVTFAIVSYMRKIISPVGALMTIALAWVAVKHGYVRSDPYHESLFCCFAILVLTFVVAQIRFTARRAAACFVTGLLFTGIALQGASGAWPVWNRFWWSPGLNLTQAARLLNFESEMKELDAVAQGILSRSPVDEYAEALGTSRVLFFPWELSYGAYRKFTTVPLFATQAYLAYTHYLDQESAAHLAAASPPVDDVFFQWESIDGRNPLADVPATWNTLFSLYQPASSNQGVLLLKRRTTPLALAFRPSSQAPFVPDAWVAVPERSTPVGLSISLKPTLFGQALQTMYKLDAVNLQVRTRSGVTSEFRVPPDVLSSPFPINSLPLSSDSLTALWTRNQVLDPIVSIRLSGPGLGHFNCDGYIFYEVSGTEIHVSAAQKALPPAPQAAAPASAEIASGNLGGYIDLVDGVAPPQPTSPQNPAIVKSGAKSVVQGWLVFGEGQAAITMDEVEATVNGKPIKAAIAQRPDVRDALHNPRLINSGFILEIDPGLLPSGVNRLDIAGRAKDGKVYRFPQPLYISPR